MTKHQVKSTLANDADPASWDDPTKTDEERWAEYKKRYDLILLPPRYPDDPKEGEYERLPGSFEVPLSEHPGWRMGFVPKGTLRMAPAVPRRLGNPTRKARGRGRQP